MMKKAAELFPKPKNSFCAVKRRRLSQARKEMVAKMKRLIHGAEESEAIKIINDFASEFSS